MRGRQYEKRKERKRNKRREVKGAKRRIKKGEKNLRLNEAVQVRKMQLKSGNEETKNLGRIKSPAGGDKN